MRYAGSPLCYHFDEVSQPVKGPILVKLREKGCKLVMETQVIAPLHSMRKLRGSYVELQTAEFQSAAQGEYIRVVLTDRRPAPEIYEFFRGLFEHRGSLLMELVSEYRQFGAMTAGPAVGTEDKAVAELFLNFYRERRDGVEPDEQEQALLCFVGEQVRHMDREDETGELERQIAALQRFALGQEGGE